VQDAIRGTTHHVFIFTVGRIRTPAERGACRKSERNQNCFIQGDSPVIFKKSLEHATNLSSDRRGQYFQAELAINALPEPAQHEGVKPRTGGCERARNALLRGW
jgi:hypothetical protein